MEKLLQKDAEDKRISVNALMNSILSKYAEWDRNVERFGFVSLGKDLFTSMLQTVDEDKLCTVADEVGGQYIKQFILFWFKKINVETFLAYLTAFSRYSGIARCDIQVTGREHVISAIHEFGPKWSNFLKHFIDKGLESTLGIAAHFEVTVNSVVVEFTTAQGPP